MENIFNYLFILLVGATVAVIYFYRKDQKRVLPLSDQAYQDARVTVSIVKEKSSARQIILAAYFKRDQDRLLDFWVELTGADKSKEVVSFSSLFQEENRPEILQTQNEFTSGVPYSALKNALTSVAFPYVSLRFVAESTTGKKYKSHQLVMSGRWGLVRMDSGIYN